MAILRNRIVAIVIMAVAIVAALFYGGGNTAQGLRAQALRVYQEGALGDGMGVAYDLIRIADNSYNLMTVARRYLAEEEPELAAMQRLHDAFEAAPDYESLQSLLEAAQALSLTLAELPLSERDEDYRVSCYVNMRSHAQIIHDDTYQALAQSYNSQIQSFPLAVFGGRSEPLPTY